MPEAGYLRCFIFVTEPAHEYRSYEFYKLHITRPVGKLHMYKFDIR